MYTFLKWLEETPEEEEERKREEEQRAANLKSARAHGIPVVDEEDEEDEEEALIFLPTGFSQPRPPTFYKGSDPEWQEFVRIAPDRSRIERIRGELVSLIRDIAIKSPQYVQRLGKINPAAGTSWIEFKFPDGPPIEFERPGIEITNDLTVRRSTRTVNELHHHRLSSILVPTAVANSLYADTKKKVGKTWQDLRVYLGWEDSSKTKVQRMLAQFPPPQLPTEPQTPTNAPASSPAPSTTSDAHQTPAPSPSPSPPEKEPASSTPGDPAYERFGIALPKPTALTLDLSTFRQAFRKEHKHVKMQPPRGTFMVSGLVEIIGEKARMTLDVSAAYDPKIGKFVMLTARLRSFTEYRQNPKGGP